MPGPMNIFGYPDERTLDQMQQAMRLAPVIGGALMPDSHLGYGLPIGGVLVCENAVMPYGVGVDIACRVRLTLTDLEISVFEDRSLWLREAIERETRFGTGCAFENPREHPIMDHEDWNLIPLDRETARAQLGTSGGGNHFVDVGLAEIDEGVIDGVPAGVYVSVLTHSGSRGAGARTCEKYSALAKERHPEGGDLAWLEFFSDEGQEYWMAMQLMGMYASANHCCIHNHLCKALGAEQLGLVENHHNFAWMEGGKVVHRKGATPAHQGELGVVPGTMVDPAFIIWGAGHEDGIFSSAHGAGRRMSRKEAKRSLCPEEWENLLQERQVNLISAGLDEAPGAYKNIHEVMEQQSVLAEVVGKFTPRMVKMA